MNRLALAFWFLLGAPFHHADAGSYPLGLQGPSSGNTIVKTVCSSGCDYATIALWTASLPSNLVTDGHSYKGELKNTAEFVNDPISLSGHTTDATHTITVTTFPGQSFSDNAGVRGNALTYNVSNGVGININSGSDAIDVADANVTISNIQVKASTASPVLYDTSSGGTTSYTNLIIYQSAVAHVAELTDGIMSNTLVIQNAANNGIDTHGLGALSFITIVAPSDNAGGTGVLYSSGAGPVVKNMAMFGFGTIANSALASTSTCMTDTTTTGGATGFTTGKTYANQFTNTTSASGDWRVKTGADLIDAGTPISGITTDISGHTRNVSTPTIGAWEF